MSWELISTDEAICPCGEERFFKIILVMIGIGIVMVP